MNTHRSFATFAAAFMLALLLFLTDTVHAESISPPADPGAAAQLRFRVFIPHLSHVAERDVCPATGAAYQTIPVLPPPTDRPAARHADLNLALRSATRVNAPLRLIDLGGPTDGAAPQLSGLFADHRTPGLTSAHQVYNWDWGCGAEGCRAAAIASPPVTLLGMSVHVGEPLHAPSRGSEIYGGGYIALVLYAEEHRLTLKYTRDDNVIHGYTVQLEDICVDPTLLRLYRQSDAAGRSSLPAVRNNQPLGVADQPELRAAIRDCGAYLDPRSRKDWWQGH